MVSVTGLRGEECVGLQDWSLGSAWGLEFQNPAACLLRKLSAAETEDILIGLSTRATTWTKFRRIHQWKPRRRTALVSPVDFKWKKKQFVWKREDLGSRSCPPSAQSSSVGANRIPSCQRNTAKVTLTWLQLNTLTGEATQSAAETTTAATQTDWEENPRGFQGGGQ